MVIIVRIMQFKILSPSSTSEYEAFVLRISHDPDYLEIWDYSLADKPSLPFGDV